MNLNQIWMRGIACGGMLLVSSLASAAIIVDTGVDNQDTDNVIENACDPHITGPALTIQGCLNTSHSTFVNFTSDESILYTGGGQAEIVALDGAFSFLQIALDDPDFTFSKLILNIDTIDSEPNGFVTFTGAPGGVSSPFALDPNDENFFTITGEDFLNVSFSTTVGIASIDLVADLKQVRIGGLESTDPDNPPPDIPEPGMLGLLGLALLTLGGRRRRRKA